MLIKRNFSVEGLDMVQLFLVAVDCHLISEQGHQSQWPYVTPWTPNIIWPESWEAYVSGICSACFFWLGQNRHIRQSFDTESQRHVYIFHCISCLLLQYCAGWVTSLTGVVLNAAAQVITGTWKFEFDRSLSLLLQSELHWLDIHQRVQFKLGVTIYRCLQNRAPQYLVDCCVHTSDVFSHQRLWSANRWRQLVVPWHRCSRFGHPSFSVPALMVWNSLPDFLWDPMLSIDNFRSALKSRLFTLQWDT